MKSEYQLNGYTFESRRSSWDDRQSVNRNRNSLSQRRRQLKPNLDYGNRQSTRKYDGPWYPTCSYKNLELKVAQVNNKSFLNRMRNGGNLLKVDGLKPCVVNKQNIHPLINPKNVREKELKKSKGKLKQGLPKNYQLNVWYESEDPDNNCHKINSALSSK